MKKLKIAPNTRIMNAKEFKKFARNKQAIKFYFSTLVYTDLKDSDFILINKKYKFSSPLPNSYYTMMSVGKLKNGKNVFDVLRWKVTRTRQNIFYVTRK